MKLILNHPVHILMYVQNPKPSFGENWKLESRTELCVGHLLADGHTKKIGERAFGALVYSAYEDM